MLLNSLCTAAAFPKRLSPPHGDETGMRVNGKLLWLHNLSTSWYTYVFRHERRGKIATESASSILPAYSGILVHDCYASYFKLPDCQHAPCSAHLLRELQGLIERDTPWAAQMHQLLLDLYKKVQSGYRLTKRHKLWRQYDQICTTADEYEGPPIKNPRGKPKQTKGRNLFDRLVKYKEAVLLFATMPDVPFTNNQAERDIRPAMIKQKNAGCFRTEKGSDRFCRIYSFLSMMRKLQRNVFNELFDLFEGQHFILSTQLPK
ncbi:MAG: IS66 family transposase [Saprospiraceae bacterium]|nr:IS66 family transposase [Saprospiraceae bacterium]